MVNTFTATVFAVINCPDKSIVPDDGFGVMENFCTPGIAGIAVGMQLTETESEYVIGSVAHAADETSLQRTFVP
jgi:hypothetical protein